MISPSAVIAAGAAAGLSLVAGLPVGAAVGIGGAAWLVRVVVAIPAATRLSRRQEPVLVDPFTVGEPWRTFVIGARQSSRRYAESVATVAPGPLRERLTMVGQRVGIAAAEIGQIARSGHQLTAARRRIDDHGLRRQLDTDPDPDVATALQAQIDAAERLDATIEATRGRLDVTTAQLGQAVTRAIEIAATSGAAMSLTGVDSDLATLVDEMESLRQALVETAPDPSSGPPPPPEPS
jgi:uncharacterized protein YPO0396